MYNSKIDEVLCSSFDQLVDSMFTNGHSFYPKADKNVFENVGDYIEIYREKKKLESQKRHLVSLIRDKNLLIRKLRKKIEQDQNKASSLTESTSAETDPTIAHLSHEIRTPMNGVLGVTELLAETGLNSEQRRYLNIIQKSSQSLLSLVNNILDYSKLTAGQMTLENINFTMKEVLSEITDLLVFQAREKGLNFSYQIDEDIPTSLNGDSLRLKQILLNLANNSLKFTKAGDVTIDVKKMQRDDGKSVIRFAVKDTGIGITRQQLSTLFKPYQQAEAGTARKFGGTGLGLTIVKNLVEMMGGKIGVNSEINKGSEFWFTLEFDTPSSMPVISSGDLSGPKTTQRKRTESSERLQILLADDDQINQTISQLILKKMGHSVTVAGSGVEAIQALKDRPYDVVLMDIQMPEMDGWEATQTIRNSSPDSLNPDIPIIALTASAMKGDQEKCERIGMTGYLTKPLEVNALNEIFGHLFHSVVEETDLTVNSPFADTCPVIDKPNLEMMRNDLEDKFLPITQMFIEALPERVERIKKAALEEDRYGLKEAAHQLKGNASNFYAERLIRLCQKLEGAAEEKSVAELAAYASLLEEQSVVVQNELRLMFN